MNVVRKHINRLTLTIVAIFAVQWVAIGFCATPASADALVGVVAPAMHAMHGDNQAMSMPCMTNEMPSTQTSSCDHCDLFDTVGVFAAESTSVDKAPLVAMLSPIKPANQTVFIQSAPDFSSLHGPPRSSSLIYSISKRILR